MPLGRSSNAITTHKRRKSKKSKVTDGLTNRQTDKAGCRVACTRLKSRTMAKKNANYLFVCVSHPSNEKNVAILMTILKLC